MKNVDIRHPDPLLPARPDQVDVAPQVVMSSHVFYIRYYSGVLPVESDNYLQTIRDIIFVNV